MKYVRFASLSFRHFSLIVGVVGPPQTIGFVNRWFFFLGGNQAGGMWRGELIIIFNMAILRYCRYMMSQNGNIFEKKRDRI
jgi:hypothetical protein